MKTKNLVVVSLLILCGCLPDVSYDSPERKPTPTAYVGDDFQFEETCLIGVSEEDYDRMNELSIAGDIPGLEQMRGMGSVAICQPGWKAKRINVHWDNSEVKLLSGPLEGRYVWVSNQFIP